MDESEQLEQLAGADRSPDGCFAMPPESTFVISEERAFDDDRNPVDEWMRSNAYILAELLRHATQGSARHALRAIPLLRKRVDELEREAVVVARSWGWSWHGIGYTLGVRGQTVHARHARDPRCRPRSVSRPKTRLGRRR